MFFLLEMVETVSRAQLSAERSTHRSCSINMVIHSGMLIR